MIEIDLKSERWRSKSLILQYIDDLKASLELNKTLFNFLSPVESFKIKGAIKICQKIYIKIKNR